MLGSVGTGFYAAQLTRDAVPDQVLTQAVAAAGMSIPDAAATAEALPSNLGIDLFDAARIAFTGGLHVTAATSAVLLAVMCTVAVWALRQGRHPQEGA
ncbi:hypothetical protein ABGB16_23710 [Micromonospora sp. B11E3]|uniref:hypothetical protein n=1 Tax=Micromonospora sp. B11E3 TaxID=3153562 RepID=UPI00325E50E0